MTARLALTLGCLLMASPAFASDVFSPGELSKGHRDLEGIDNCTKCHPAGKALSQEVCLDCHTELAPRVQKGRGFHGNIPSGDQRNCENCHKEHLGADFELVDWGKPGKKAFNHTKAGWPLKGKHAEVECVKCHEPRLITDAAILKLLKKNPKRDTYLGAPTDCEGCHFDEHRGQVEKRGGCENCHVEKAWKPAVGFNHDKSDYPLKGKHQKVECIKCHIKLEDEVTPKTAFPAPVNKTYFKYAPIDHKTCLACHEDVHQGRFGEKCESCHVVEDWHLIRDGSKQTAFHEKTRYPLRGEHVDVSCRACHGPFPGQPARFKNMQFEKCTDCHFDAHVGQLSRTAKGPKGPDCASCHAVEGFTPALFSIATHQKTKYALEGAHVTVACNACHKKTPALESKVPATTVAVLKRQKRPVLFSSFAITFSKPTDKCETCHDDIHGGQFDKNNKGGCVSCHQVESFAKLKFDHDKDSRYPLTGKHRDTKCNACHLAPAPDDPVRYKPLTMDCWGCHADAHAGQFAVKPGQATDCTRCHDTADWKKTKFKHEPPFTAYLLDGKHEKVACEKCHVKVAVGPKLKVQQFKGVPQACESCHADFHKGAFKGFAP